METSIKDYNYLIILLSNWKSKSLIRDMVKDGNEKDSELFTYWLQLFNITPEQKQGVVQKFKEAAEECKNDKIDTHK